MAARALVAATMLTVGSCEAGPLQGGTSSSSTWTAQGALTSFGGDPRHHPITFSDGERGYLLTGVADKFDMFRFEPTVEQDGTTMGGPGGAWTEVRKAPPGAS